MIIYTLLKRIVPAEVKLGLKTIHYHTIRKAKLMLLIRKMRIKHRKLQAVVKDKEKIKIVCLAYSKSVWKIETVVRKLMQHDKFEIEVLVIPQIGRGDDYMHKQMEEMYEFLRVRGFPVRKSYDANNKSWLDLAELTPDLLFFLNPHDITLPQYYEEAYLNYLSCYFPYHHEGDINVKDYIQYNLPFHNAMWKIFTTNSGAYADYHIARQDKANNVCLIGYPFIEEVLDKINNNKCIDVWKTNDGRKRVIWAPHHTIENSKSNLRNKKMSNFIEYAEQMQQLAMVHSGRIVWAFKPHPGLKYKLYKHPDWGIEKTNDFYDFWQNNEFTQLNLGDYIDLFQFSDAMIHDCGSFLNEYLYFKKPVLYMTSNEKKNYYNSFGIKAIDACKTASDFKDINLFINDLLKNKLHITIEHNAFINELLEEYYVENTKKSKKPSDHVLDLLLEITTVQNKNLKF